MTLRVLVLIVHNCYKVSIAKGREDRHQPARVAGQKLTMLVKDKTGASPGTKSRRSRGRPSLKQVADIERELLDVALKVFLKDGYGGTSISNIVKAAGVSKTTLYSRYSSKEELFLAIIRRVFESNRVADRMKEGYSSLGLEEGLKAYSQVTLEIGMNSIVRGIDRLIFSEAHRFPELSAAAAQLYDGIFSTLREFIGNCAQRDGIPCRDPARLAEAVIDLTRGFHVRSMVTNRSLTSDEISAWADRTIGLLLESREDL